MTSVTRHFKKKKSETEQNHNECIKIVLNKDERVVRLLSWYNWRRYNVHNVELHVMRMCSSGNVNCSNCKLCTRPSLIRSTRMHIHCNVTWVHFYMNFIHCDHIIIIPGDCGIIVSAPETKWHSLPYGKHFNLLGRFYVITELICQQFTLIKWI